MTSTARTGEAQAPVSARGVATSFGFRAPLTLSRFTTGASSRMSVLKKRSKKPWGSRGRIRARRVRAHDRWPLVHDPEPQIAGDVGRPVEEALRLPPDRVPARVDQDRIAGLDRQAILVERSTRLVERHLLALVLGRVDDDRRHHPHAFQGNLLDRLATGDGVRRCLEVRPRLRGHGDVVHEQAAPVRLGHVDLVDVDPSDRQVQIRRAVVPHARIDRP